MIAFTSQAGMIVRLYLFLTAANLLVWGWAWLSLAHHSALLGTAVLAYSFGLRHALDCDHIAAIDNVTRRLMQQGQRPLLLGFYFALGHSLVVILASLAVAFAAGAAAWLPQLQRAGALLSTSVSTVFLTAIGLLNLWILADIVRTVREARRGGAAGESGHDPYRGGHVSGRGHHQHGGWLTRMMHPLFGRIAHSWQMAPLGFVFGLGFETATEVALLGTAAVQASQGAGLLHVMLYPALFTVGMLTVDATDGVLMLRVYGWAFVQPLRKLYYNLALTLISTLVALFIAGINIASLWQERFHPGGRWWRLLGQAHDKYSAIGYLLAGLFALCWLGSHLWYRWDRAAKHAIDHAAMAATLKPTCAK